MEFWRTALLIATVVGFLVTVGGLVAAYFAAKYEYDETGTRVTLMQSLAEEEKTARDKLGTITHENSHLAEELNTKYDGIYASHGLTRPSYGNMVYLAIYETRRLLGMVLKETRRDFIISGVGLLVSTAASVGSLYLSGQ